MHIVKGFAARDPLKKFCHKELRLLLYFDDVLIADALTPWVLQLPQNIDGSWQLNVYTRETARGMEHDGPARYISSSVIGSCIRPLCCTLTLAREIFPHYPLPRPATPSLEACPRRKAHRTAPSAWTAQQQMLFGKLPLPRNHYLAALRSPNALQPPVSLPPLPSCVRACFFPSLFFPSLLSHSRQSRLVALASLCCGSGSRSSDRNFWSRAAGVRPTEHSVGPGIRVTTVSLPAVPHSCKVAAACCRVRVDASWHLLSWHSQNCSPARLCGRVLSGWTLT